MTTENTGEFVKVAVDLDVCEAAAVCTRMAPAIFHLDDDDINHIVKQPDTEELDRKTRLAVRRCPKQALYFLNDPAQDRSS